MISTSNTDSKILRDYGLLMGAVIAALFGLYPWIILKKQWVSWPFVSLGVFWGVSLVYPKLLAPLYRLWMFVGHILGKINSTLLLTVCYLILFVPLAFIFRLMKRDRLRRLSSQEETSFRVKRDSVWEKNQMKLPF